MGSVLQGPLDDAGVELVAAPLLTERSLDSEDDVTVIELGVVTLLLGAELLDSVDSPVQAASNEMTPVMASCRKAPARAIDPVGNVMFIGGLAMILV